MKKKYKLAVIGANEPLIPFYSQIDTNKFEIYGFAWADGAVCEKYCKKFFPISFTDKETILAVCKEINIDGITSFSLESAVPTVNFVAAKLGLTCNSDKILEWVGHKNKMRLLLERTDLPMPRSILMESGNSLTNIELPELPLIVKPVDGGGSKGITLIQKNIDLMEAINYALNFSRIKQVVIEEYIEGPEVSVEYISYQGKHYFIAITDKTTSGEPHFIELEHKQPSKLPIYIQEQIKRVVEKSLTELGVTNSPSHTELKIDKKRGPIIIEVGPRMGGGCITSHLVKLSTGYDFVNAACSLACNQFIRPVNLEKRLGKVLFYTPYTKENVENIQSKDENIIYDNLSELEINCSNNSERSGCIIIKGI